MAIKILLQTTIVPTVDDWSIARFELLSNFLRKQTDVSGNPAFEVTARDRASTGNDPVLSSLHRSDFDEMWLFAVDTGNGCPGSSYETGEPARRLPDCIPMSRGPCGHG